MAERGRDNDGDAVNGKSHAALGERKVSFRMACSLGCKPPPPTP